MKYIKEIKILETQLDLLLKDNNLYIKEIFVNTPSNPGFSNSSLLVYDNFLLKNKDLIIKNKIISLLVDLSKLKGDLEDNNRIEKIILDYKNPQLVFDYIDRVLNRPWKDAEEIILSDLDVAFNYCYNFKQKRWSELEKKLYLSPMNAAIYAHHILDKPWSDINIKPELVKKIEDSISNDLDAASYYSLNVIKKWPQGEKILATDPKSATNYAARINERFPEGEKIISNSPNDAIDYAWIILEKPWSESKDVDPKISENAEKNIALSAESSFQYAKKVFKGRWKKGEKSILKNKEVLIKYIKQIIEEPWEEAEDIISTDSEVSYEYAKKLEKRFIKGESVIADYPFIAYIYSKNILQQKWKEVEGIDPKIANKAEESIKNSQYDFVYNRDEF